MKNRLIKDILVLLVMLAIIVVICRFLPEKVPIHFNAKGEADMFANKYYLLLATVTLILHIGSLLGKVKIKRLNETPSIFTNCIKIKNDYFKR